MRTIFWLFIIVLAGWSTWPGGASHSWAMEPSQLSNSTVALGEEQEVKQGRYAFRPLKNWSFEVKEEYSFLFQDNGEEAASPLIFLRTIDIKKFVGFQRQAVGAINSETLLDHAYLDLAHQSKNHSLTQKRSVQILGRTGYMGELYIDGVDGGKDVLKGQLAVVQIDSNHFFSMSGLIKQPAPWIYNREFLTVLQSVRLLTTNSSPSTDNSVAKTIPTQAPIINSGNYTLQIAAFNNVSEAESLVLRLKSLGVTADIVSAQIPNKGLWHRVQVGRFATFADASRYGAILRAKDVIKEFVIAKR